MIKKILLLFFVCGGCVGTALAATDGFNIRLLVGEDTTPPTTPSSLTAIPVAQTQIDLTWTASTDNLLVSGYQIYRNALQIATTSLTTYFDSGLTASTTYTYYVRAFDSSFNFSSSSNIASTTTLPVIATSTPTTTSSTNSSSSSSGDAQLESFTIVPSLYSVRVTWKTSKPAQFELRWGRTASYELGFVANELFKKEHTTNITNLLPGTLYEYQLIAHNRSGNQVVLKTAQFRTLDAPDTQAPPNVSNLRAIAQGENVRLVWDNPTDPDFSNVRIVRSYLFYPNDPQDGFVAYTGEGSSYVDSGALSLRSPQYYTVFAYDETGNVSSGAVVAVRSEKNIKSGEEVDYATTTKSSTLLFDSITLLQKGATVWSSDIDGSAPLVFRIPYHMLPEHLKTITVTLTHPDDPKNTFSFLLRINKDKTFYEATIAPLLLAGTYPTKISVYDYQTKSLQVTSGELIVHLNSGSDAAFSTSAFLTTFAEETEIPTVAFTGLFIFIFYPVYLLWRIFLRRP